MILSKSTTKKGNAKKSGKIFGEYSAKLLSLHRFLRKARKTLIFASLSEESTESLDYGVMVAQQVLVLFVQVRILVVQLKKSLRVVS